MKATPTITTGQVLQLHDYPIKSMKAQKACATKSERRRQWHGHTPHSTENFLNPNTFEHAAATGESVLINQPFVDSNKRTGLLLTDLMLMFAGCRLELPFEEGCQFVVDLATGELRFDEAAVW